MSARNAVMHWIDCDSCNARVGIDGETPVYDSHSEAVEAALDADWSTDSERWHCWDCPRLATCEVCYQPAGDLAGERDYLCQTCWDADSAAANGAVL